MQQNSGFGLNQFGNRGMWDGMNAVKTFDEKALIMNSLLRKSDRFVVVDIEVTGLSPNKGGRIIEVAGVRVDGEEITDTYSQLINPEQKIYAKTIQLTGITNEMLADKPVYGKVLPEFYRFIGDRVVVSHNAMFDWDRFLCFFFWKVGIIAKNPVIDTLRLSKLYYPYKKKHGLQEMCEEAGISVEKQHRALDDALALAKLLIFYKKYWAPRFEYGADSEQLGLDVEDEGTNNAVPKPLKVKRVSYWEKQVGRSKKYQRIYVMTSLGTVYFDIPTMTWYNKDVSEAIDFEHVQSAVLKYLGMESLDELAKFRKSK